MGEDSTYISKRKNNWTIYSFFPWTLNFLFCIGVKCQKTDQNKKRGTTNNTTCTFDNHFWKQGRDSVHRQCQLPSAWQLCDAVVRGSHHQGVRGRLQGSPSGDIVGCSLQSPSLEVWPGQWSWPQMVPDSPLLSCARDHPGPENWGGFFWGR